MAACMHIVRFMGMCAECGEIVSDDEEQEVVLCSNGISVRKDHAYTLLNTGRKRLVKERKLALILDLDKTLLHATADDRAALLPDIRVLSPSQCVDVPFDQDDVIVKQTLGTDDNRCNYYVKYRPGLIEFLDKASQKFELWIFTAGTRPYAEFNASVMDPTGALFADRIVSRDDLPADYKPGRQVFKSLEAVFPFDDTFAIILDDSPDVWGANMSNLLPVSPYTFFTGFQDVNNFANTSVAGKQRKTRHDQRMLDSIWTVVLEARTRFFAGENDIKVVLTQLKTNVLQGVCICFSGLVSNKKTVQGHPTTELAQSFGATVKASLTPEVTHLVAKHDGTLKVGKAREMPDVYVVSAEWMYDSIAYYNRQSESNYEFNRPSKRRKPLDS